eukprot:768679-Hanusia_phi.AAC.7
MVASRKRREERYLYPSLPLLDAPLRSTLSSTSPLPSPHLPSSTYLLPPSTLPPLLRPFPDKIASPQFP